MIANELYEEHGKAMQLSVGSRKPKQRETEKQGKETREREKREKAKPERRKTDG